MSNLEEMKKKYPISEEIPQKDLRNYKFSEIDPCSKNKKSYEDIVLNWQYPMWDQGQIGECTGCALAGLMNYSKNVAPNKRDMFSPGFLYGYRPDGYRRFLGLNINDGLKTCVKVGNVKYKDFSIEKNFPGIETDLRPNLNKLLQLAEKYKMDAYVEIEKDEIKEFIHKYNNPTIMIVLCYEDFYDCLTNGGEFPSKSKGNLIGSHAVVCIGQKDGYDYIVNSWGEKGLFKIKADSENIHSIFGFTDSQSVQEQATHNYGWEKIERPHPSGTKILWKYLNQDGTYLKNGWLQLGKDWFYFKEEYALANDWIYYKNKWYYFDSNCYMKTNYWCYWKDKWYYLKQDGAMAENEWIQDKDGRWYYLSANGEMQTGWIQLKGIWYYLEPSSNGFKGECYINRKATIDGKEYSFDKYGHMIENGVSDNLVNFIKGYEGYFNHWYNAGDGYDTIGYGTATSGKVGKRLKSKGITSCTKSQATAWLKEEINNMASSIKDKLNADGRTLSQNQFDALASFAYNCGTASLFGSTLWKYVINGNSASDIQIAFLMWNKCNGRSLEGLTKRRQAEADMYNYGVYNSNH